MDSREKILSAIRAGKPDLVPLPATPRFVSDYPDLAEQFGTVLQGIGGEWMLVDEVSQIEPHLRQLYDLSHPVISLVPEVKVGNLSPLATDQPHGYEHLHLVVLRGQVGVAENAAIWVDEQNFPIRALPFIALNVAMVLHEDQLVANMHEAYAQLTFRTGYGTFIAGPSKTADIEQSLVIGAHGPKRMTVYLVRKRSPEV